MSTKITFDELIAKREQREADKLKIGTLQIPGSTQYLEAVMPGKKVVMDIYGELAMANNATAALLCGNHALYAVCPQLQDRKLQESVGVADDPMGIIDALFSLADQDDLGVQALEFLGLMKRPEKTEGIYQDADPEEGAENPALDTVKN